MYQKQTDGTGCRVQGSKDDRRRNLYYCINNEIMFPNGVCTVNKTPPTHPDNSKLMFLCSCICRGSPGESGSLTITIRKAITIAAVTAATTTTLYLAGATEFVHRCEILPCVGGCMAGSSPGKETEVPMENPVCLTMTLNLLYTRCRWTMRILRS